MTKRERIIWFAGLFEGEGSFSISKEKYTKGLKIPMTDLDVLERVQEYFGGNIYKVTKRKKHWKDAWVWSIAGEEAYKLVLEMQPFLMSRRLERSQDWIRLFKLRGKKKKRNKERNLEIHRLSEEGLTHSQIAEKVNLERSSVSKILKMVL